MKRVPLTRGKFALVDDADYPDLIRFAWNARKDNNTWYASRGWVRADGTHGFERMHRRLLPGATRVDHWDGDGLNNQRHNLRAATASQNQMNSRKRRGCSSRYKGVSWQKDAQAWRPRIRVDGKLKSLGLFADEREAAQAYDRAAVAFFGPFARINFPA
jgi:hypothetical protein